MLSVLTASAVLMEHAAFPADFLSVHLCAVTAAKVQLLHTLLFLYGVELLMR